MTLVERVANALGWYRWWVVEGGPGHAEIRPTEYGDDGKGAYMTADLKRQAMDSEAEKGKWCPRCDKVTHRPIWLRVRP